METTLLVSKADFKDYADLAESLDIDRLRPHILGAQRHRLRPILTDALMTELQRQVAAATAQVPVTGIWADLWAKSVPVVASGAMARYLPFSQTTATSNSMVRKSSQYSEATDSRDLARQATIYDGDALSFEATLTTWLKVNGKLFSAFYPPATCCGPTESSRTSSVVVQAIRRPDELAPSSPHRYR